MAEYSIIDKADTERPLNILFRMLRGSLLAFNNYLFVYASSVEIRVVR